MTTPGNPFRPENNQFSMGEQSRGLRDNLPGQNTSSDGEQDPTEMLGGPAPVPESTKPRQMPGGAAPMGLGAPGPGGAAPLGLAPAGGDGGASPLGRAPAGGANQGIQQMPFTNPVGGTNVPQPSADAKATAVRRAVAIRNEVLASNPGLDPVQAMTLAKAAVGIQMQAYGDDPMDRSRWRGNNHPLNNPGHPFWNTPQGRAQISQGFGPNNARGQGGDPTNGSSLNQKGWDVGYQGKSPAWVGLGVQIFENLVNRRRDKKQQANPNDPDLTGAHGEESGNHPGSLDILPGQDTGKGRHLPGGQPGRPDHAPGGPPTPHPHPEAPQPGNHSVPYIERNNLGYEDHDVPRAGGHGIDPGRFPNIPKPQAPAPNVAHPSEFPDVPRAGGHAQDPRPGRGSGFDWSSLWGGNGGGKHRVRPTWRQDPSKATQDVLPYGRGQQKHRRASLTAVAVYGE